MAIFPPTTLGYTYIEVVNEEWISWNNATTKTIRPRLMLNDTFLKTATSGNVLKETIGDGFAWASCPAEVAEQV